MRALPPARPHDLPGRDAGGVRGVPEAHPGQVRADGAGQALAPRLCPLRGLRLRPQREVLLQGRQDLLQDRLLQVTLLPIYISDRLTLMQLELLGTVLQSELIQSKLLCII